MKTPAGTRGGQVPDRLARLRLTVPVAPKGVAAYESWMVGGDLVVTSFQLPWEDGTLAHQGRLGWELTVAEGRHCARLCALNAVAQLGEAVESLDEVRLLRVEGHVGTTNDFTRLSDVIDGASELFHDIFADRGRHCRLDLAHSTMPLDSPVMIGLWAQVL